MLLVDFDPQGALSVGLGIQPHELDATVYNLLMERGVTAHDVVIKTKVDGMDLLPSNIDLSGAEVQLVHEVGREFVLGRVLQPVLPDYDIILIDCQPSLGLADGQRARLRGWRARAAGVRVLRAARRRAADGDHRQGVEQAQPEARPSTGCSPPCTTRVPCTPGRSWPESSRASATGSSTPSSAGRCASLTLRLRENRSRVRPGVAMARARTGSWPRRYWRGGGRAFPQVPSAPGKPSRRRGTAAPAGRSPAPETGQRPASGRESHSHKITVYLSGAELIELERARWRCADTG